MKKYVFESLKFFCAAILCTILSAFATPSHAALPDGYTELQYIESTGTQWIDTGVVPEIGDTFDIDYKYTTLPSGTNYQTLMSAGTGNYQLILLGSNNIGAESTRPLNGFYYKYFATGEANAFETTPSVNEWYNITINSNGTATSNGQTSTSTPVEELDGANTSLYLFIRRNGTAPFYGAIRKFQMSRNGALVRNFVPAKNSSGVVGMYDTVGNRFYTNAGTGEFVAGPDACNGTVVNYVSATGTGVQNGTPTPTNPIEPTFYKQGNMILRKVGNVADSYDATTGKITRRVGVKVFDGSEASWYEPNTNQRSISKAYLGMVPSGTTSVFVTHYPSGGAETRDSVYVGSQYVNFIVGSQYTMEQWKQYLAQQYANGTPVTIYYPLAEETTEDWPETSYCETPIKIATTKYNESAFSPLNTALANAISVVDSVVSNTITQAGRIATLQAQKQTRPNDIADDNEKCPAYKQCLLVEDENGTPHWYEITDPFRDFVAPIIAQGISPNDTVAVFDAGYTQLEYIESTGTQWIDTGVTTPASNSTVTKFEANVAYVSSAANQRNFIAGYKDYTHGHYCEFRNDKFGFSNGSIGYYSPTLTAETPYDVTMQINGSNNVQLGINIGGTDYTKSFTQYQGDTMGQFVLFMLDSSYISKGLRMYSAKLTINNTLVRNFVPVRNNATGKYGMYDTVGQRFYGNAASSGDDFTAGPVVANDADVPVPQWIRAWDANAQYNLSAGEVYGTAQCNNLSGTEHAQKATSAQMASSGWLENGAKCWCKVVGINVDNEYTEAPATASWVFDAVRPSVEDCNKMCAAACSNRTLGEAAFRKALFGD